MAVHPKGLGQSSRSLAQTKRIVGGGGGETRMLLIQPKTVCTCTTTVPQFLQLSASGFQINRANSRLIKVRESKR